MSPEFHAMERVEVVTYPCCECGENSNAYAQFRDGDYMCQRCCEDVNIESLENMPDDVESDLDDEYGYEDDGQPTEYEEWQDYMGGDDNPADWDRSEGYFDDLYGEC